MGIVVGVRGITGKGNLKELGLFGRLARRRTGDGLILDLERVKGGMSQENGIRKMLFFVWSRWKLRSTNEDQDGWGQ